VFGTGRVEEGGLSSVDTRLASEMIVRIITLRAAEHHATTPRPRQERNHVEKPLAEILTMAYT